MSRLHNWSQKPGFWESLWDAAWPISVWSEVLADSLPVPDNKDGDYSYGSYSVVHVDIMIESSQKLYVAWEWLDGQLLKTFTAAFIKALCAARPMGADATVLETSLYRPARHTRFQEIMSQSTHFWGPEYFFKTFTSSPEDQYHYSYFEQNVPVLPSHMQRVTVTGPWCHNLPDAKWSLSHAHFGNGISGTVKGDRFSPGEPLMRYADFDEFLYLDDDYMFSDEGIVAEQRLKPFTCEVDVEPQWFNY